ncbi:hypothetical protein BTN49_3331 [Candidatus Enterovibrio escicola]|uniref:Uncharacterized protein n=1 Tax=Candidatus Enterovibrio escicola TaxID=1927127 RepID=A0A2A5SZ60_9GAMM|nr:hypothetical protein BTN49_3331 [Candidatus Enterovibrio escacola]
MSQNNYLAILNAEVNLKAEINRQQHNAEKLKLLCIKNVIYGILD